jgi:two-component system NtrC family sensor kinase
MKAPPWTRSLKSRIMISYSLILILGGLSTSAIGIHVTGRALLRQADQQMVYGLAAARSTYVHSLQELRQSVELLSSSGRLQAALAANQPVTAATYLAAIRQEHGLDFLSVTDPAGKVIVRTSGSGLTGDMVMGVAPIDRALQGEPASSTEVLPLEFLRAEDAVLAQRAAITLIETPKARPTDRKTLNAGMALVAAAPATDESGRLIAVVYAGRLLNHPSTDVRETGAHWMVDGMDTILSPGQQAEERRQEAVTIFQDDVRITSNLATDDNQRAIGTRASREVYEAVISQDRPWMGLAYAVNDWYITAYEPIINLKGERIGMLAVGLLERPYTTVRNEVTLSFAAIALFCFVLIVVVTYFLTRSLVRPLEEMVSVSQSIAADDLSRRVHVTDHSELGLLSTSFNDMLDRISEMKSQLEQWAKTLEQKVKERTDLLVKVQTQVARQQRLASVGQLAAGVAHEINNPLGGILTFASLVLEDLPPDSPNRQDLEEIVQQAVRCRKIVTELLEFSREREAQMDLANVNEVLSRTVALLEKQALFHDIQVTRTLDPNMPAIVMDESQMQQVFMNIVLNAVHAMNERGELTIETWHDDKRRMVSVRISDTGCGIPSAIREAIFDPFFTTKDPGQGTGLGLAVAARIVQAHGGRTEVESEVGKGTSFIISLPIGTTAPYESDRVKGQNAQETR